MEGLRSSVGVAASPFTKGPYTWDQRLNFTAASLYTAPSLSVGTYGSGAVVDTSLLDNIQFSVNVRTATNKTVADTSTIGAYIGCGNTADTIHNKLQALLVTNSVAYDCFDAYCVQGNMSIKDDMATHAGNANLVAGAFKVSIADGKTATGNVSSLYLVTGDTDATTGDTATGSFDVIRVENNSTQVDNVLNIGGATNIDQLMTIDAAAGFVVASAVGGSQSHKLKIVIAGTDYYIPLNTA